MPISLQYDVNASDWGPFLRTAVTAIERWAKPVQGPGANVDTFGKYYDIRIRDDIVRKVDIKDNWVLRPATLHLGAHKVLQNQQFYKHGFRHHTLAIWDAVAFNHALHDSNLGILELDFLVQVAWFRGEVLFP